MASTVTDKALGLCVDARTFDLRGEEGQAAPAYMGLVTLAAFIVFALITTTDVDTKMSTTGERLVGAIANGSDPSSGS